MNNLSKKRSTGILGNAGSGKTTALKDMFEKIREQEEVKTISINCSNSELVQQASGITKNKISTSYISDQSPLNLKMLDVAWQDLEIDSHTTDLPMSLISLLTERVIEFVKKSDKPCVILIEELWQFGEEGIKALDKIRQVIVQNNGYFIFTSTDGQDIAFITDKVDDVIRCGNYNISMAPIPFTRYPINQGDAKAS